ncbi:MAG: DUF1611 domain-containing protein [Proteobacteria bacterium]|nr:DUF1611 domain-containing protein [Pseudomonadota bacterium]
MRKKDGRAIVYCAGAFNTPNGKTAHGLVRFTRRYNVVSVVDPTYAGQDAGFVLDGENKDIPVAASIEEAIDISEKKGTKATHLVIGLAPDGGRLSDSAREDVKKAIAMKLHVDCGLHDFISEDAEMVALSEKKGVMLRDIRKPPERKHLHFFSGKIEEVTIPKIAVLGTDSAVGKRTTAWLLVHAFEKKGFGVEMIGTGQTAWMQGAKHSILMDSLVNDFVSGEIEHAVYQAWQEEKPDVIVIEGQGSLMNPAYPGGFEILAAGRPDMVVLQHAPARMDYDGFPGYPIHPLARQIQAIEMISGRPVVAITINHEDMFKEEIPMVCDAIKKITGLPAFDPLLHGGMDLADTLIPFFKKNK